MTANCIKIKAPIQDQILFESLFVQPIAVIGFDFTAALPSEVVEVRTTRSVRAPPETLIITSGTRPAVLEMSAISSFVRGCALRPVVRRSRIQNWLGFSKINDSITGPPTGRVRVDESLDVNAQAVECSK